MAGALLERCSDLDLGDISHREGGEPQRLTMGTRGHVAAMLAKLACTHDRCSTPGAFQEEVVTAVGRCACGRCRGSLDACGWAPGASRRRGPDGGGAGSGGPPERRRRRAASQEVVDVLKEAGGGASSPESSPECVGHGGETANVASLRATRDRFLG